MARSNLIKESIVDKNTYCVSPFNEVHINSWGKVRFCCQHFGIAENVNNTTLQDAFQAFEYKKARLDLSIVEINSRASVAGVFTQNKAKSPAVIISQKNLKKGCPRFLIINAGNANAGTGKDGYDDAVKYCLDNLNDISFCAGTHNENSSAKLVQLIDDNNIDKTDKRIYFAQLLGMSDHISFNVAHNGYNVAKYVPYGPIEEVMPYLIRRAEENTSVTGQMGRELGLIVKEKARRKSLK